MSLVSAERPWRCWSEVALGDIHGSLESLESQVAAYSTTGCHSQSCLSELRVGRFLDVSDLI